MLLDSSIIQNSAKKKKNTKELRFVLCRPVLRVLRVQYSSHQKFHKPFSSKPAAVILQGNCCEKCVRLYKALKLGTF